MRGSGNTTKIIYQALMSDRPIVFIFAPKQHMTSHLRRLIIKHGGKPDEVRNDMAKIGSKTYYFWPISIGIHQRLLPIKDYDVFYDHTIFEMNESFVVEEMRIINEITLHKRALTDGKV